MGIHFRLICDCVCSCTCLFCCLFIFFFSRDWGVHKFFVLYVNQEFLSLFVLLLFLQIHTTSQSSPMQAYNQSINDLDRELDHLKNAFEVKYVFMYIL